MGQLLRILVVEDSEEDSFLLLRELHRAGYEPVSERVASAESMAAALDRQSWDIIISDYVLPGFGGLEALAICRQRGLDAPFLLVSGHIGEDIAVSAIQAGADDYLMKDRLARLGSAVGRALERAEIRREHKRSIEALRLSHEQLSQARSELEKRVQERTAALMAANAELQKQMQERRRLENELLDIAENERRRIGFDLHDDIGQKLMGVSLLLKALETNLHHRKLSQAEEARQAQTLLEQVVNHTHDLAHCFSSMDNHGDDLLVLLKKLIENVRSNFDIVCRLRTAGPLPTLSPEATLQLYKIAQESVTNAIKHGHAGRLWISVTTQNGEAILQIRNDGKAFPVRCEANNRLGLKIMEYRARTIGGTLHIRPNGNAGTIVTCRIPALDHFSGAAPELGAAAGTQNGEHRRPANLLEQAG